MFIMLLNLHSPWVYDEIYKINKETMKLLDKTQELAFKKESHKWSDILRDHLRFTCDEFTYNVVPDDKLKNYKNTYKQIEKSNIDDKLKYNCYINLANIFINDVYNYADDAPIEFAINFYRSQKSGEVEKQRLLCGSYACMIANAKIELQKGECTYATINAYDDTTNDFTYRLTEILANPNTSLPEETDFIYRKVHLCTLQ